VEPSFTNQQINSIIVDESRHDYRFVYHALRLVRNRIRGLASGAATPIINKADFSLIRLPMPPLEVQRRVVTAIAPYDLLIENFRRRNRVLRRTRELLLSKLIGDRNSA
jgi:type I restriction enzyme S subunit